MGPDEERDERVGGRPTSERRATSVSVPRHAGLTPSSSGTTTIIRLFDAFVARSLKTLGAPRTVVNDADARDDGGRDEEPSLVPLGEPRRGRIGLDERLRRSPARA
jgi:hypothetical protein